MGMVLELLKREYVVVALILLTLGILPQLPNIPLCARRMLVWLSKHKWDVIIDSKPIDFVFLGLFFCFGFSKLLG